MLFDEDTCSTLMTVWPSEPAVYDLPACSSLPDIAGPSFLDGYLTTGAAPADKVIIIKDGAALHPRAYTTAGHLDPAKVAKWRGRGYTLQLRTINRWCPPLNAVCSDIQRETGYGCFVTGFVTPAGGYGLNPHWDQNMGLIYQVVGRKTWPVWKPVVEEPHLDHLASNAVPGIDLVNRLRNTVPDHEFDLQPGQILVLPRGWMHNPHTHGHQNQSVHLTFVLRERTGFWVSDRLARKAIASTALRRAIPPAQVVDVAAFAEQVDVTRNHLMDWLALVDQHKLATELLGFARTEQDVDYT